jgi:hypothetical protein
MKYFTLDFQSAMGKLSSLTHDVPMLNISRRVPSLTPFNFTSMIIFPLNMYMKC